MCDHTNKIMEEKSKSLMRSALQSGIYLGIVLVLLSVIFKVTGAFFASWTAFVMYLAYIVGVVWAQLRYRKALGGEISYGKAFGVGLMTMIFASVLTSIYTYILYKLDPSLIEQVRLQTEQKLVEGNFPEEQIDTMIKMQSMFMKPAFFAIVGIFGGACWGLFISLISAIFTKKESQN